MPLETHLGGALHAAFAVVGGAQAPIIFAIPSFPFNCFLSLAVFISQAVMDEVFRATTMVTVHSSSA